MSLTRRAMILGLAGTGLFATQTKAAGVQIDGGLAFGSSWRITADDTVDLATLKPDLESVFNEIDAQMSPYRARSPLSVFNTGRGRAWHNMPTPVCFVASEALRIARLTNGAFDPTVGPLVSRFGFGPIEGGFGNHTGIEVSGNTLRKAAPDLTMDLCGIAKGYALDRIAETLGRAGVGSALIEVGGEVKALGRHPGGRQWAVAIGDPTAFAFQPYRVVTPGEYALATSGHSANGLSGPVTTSHIINPHLRQPATTDLASVSVLARTGIEADAFATALCAAGKEKGIALAQRLNISAMFVARSNAGPSDIMTGRFLEHVLV